MSKSWKNTAITHNSSIRDALILLDKEALRIALVVDDNDKLLGVLTDGDIRRGLLRNCTLNSPVVDVMNSSPLTAEFGTPRRELVKLMTRKKLLSIPLVKNGKVVGLETLQAAEDIVKYDNPVFLMAGGFGSRLKPLTDACPKPMLKVGNKPILEIVLNSFIRAGFHNFYISLHYMPEQVQAYFGDGSRWNVSINYIYEQEPLGTGGALGLLPDILPNLPLILMNGDLLTTIDFEQLLQFHNKNQADATMCVRDYEYQIPFGVINGEGNKVTTMVEKPIQRLFVNAGIYVINPDVRKQVKANQRIDMPSLLEQNIEQNRNVLMFPIHEYWLDIGRMDDYQRAQIDVVNLGLY
jgi:dTDP-glucose pyrophosphorylase